MLFLAGHTGTAANEPPNLNTQARRTFAELEEVLKSAGGSLNDIVTMTVFITDVRLGPEFPGSEKKFSVVTSQRAR